MSTNFPSLGAGVAFEEGDSFLQDQDYNEFADSLLELTPDIQGYDDLTDVQQDLKDEDNKGVTFFDEAFEPTLDYQGDLGGAFASSSSATSASAIFLEALSEDSGISLSHSLDDVGFITLNNKHVNPLAPLTASSYTPLPSVLAIQPEPSPPKTVYQAYSSYFRTSDEAKAYRRRPRLAPKSQALDIKRVKQFGRDYWVRRLYNAMVDVSDISDGEQSIHRLRFTQKPLPFNPLDLEATAHYIFEEAIAVHERGWNRPTVYHKKVLRGKLVDLSETSLEMRLGRICLCLQQKKSSVDDAIRGGVTLALLCDNPEARSFTKESNDIGNKKRGERLKATSTKAKARKAQQEATANQDVQKVQEQVDPEHQSS